MRCDPADCSVVKLTYCSAGRSDDGGEEGDWFGEDVFDAEAHGLAVEEFHLQEADLHVDELVDEGYLAGCDRVELFDVVGGDGEGEVVV